MRVTVFFFSSSSSLQTFSQNRTGCFPLRKTPQVTLCAQVVMYRANRHLILIASIPLSGVFYCLSLWYIYAFFILHTMMSFYPLSQINPIINLAHNKNSSPWECVVDVFFWSLLYVASPSLGDDKKHSLFSVFSHEFIQLTRYKGLQFSLLCMFKVFETILL